MKTTKELRDIILDESKKGNVVYSSFEGLMMVKLDDIIKQPVEGLLYDLNRDVATILTFINDPKWVNDYAVCSVITALHRMAFSQPPVGDKVIEKQEEVITYFHTKYHGRFSTDKILCNLIDELEALKSGR